MTDEAQYELWNDTHTASLEDYGLNERTGDPMKHPLYHPDAAKHLR